MKILSRILLLFGVSVVSSCGPAPQAPTTQIIVPVQRDYVVLQTLLLDLLTHPRFATLPGLSNGTEIVLAVHTSDWTYLLNAEQIRIDIRDQSLPSELVAALSEQNRPNTVAYFTNFTFDSNIVVTDLTGKMRWDVFADAHPKARGWVAVFLPGYSKDGTRAVVRAQIGPSSHGAVVTALLEKSGDKWSVKWHELGFYL